MNDHKIEQIKSILKHWNPLGNAAHSVKDLNDYETEVLDIIFQLTIECDFPEKKVTQKQVSKMVKEILNDAFNLYLTNSDCEVPSKEILEVLKQSGNHA